MSYEFKITTNIEGNLELEGTWTEHYPGSGADEVEPLNVEEHMPGLFLVNRGEADDWDETIVVSLRVDGEVLRMNVIVHDIYNYPKVMTFQSDHFRDGKTNTAFADRLAGFLNTGY